MSRSIIVTILLTATMLAADGGWADSGEQSSAVVADEPSELQKKNPDESAKGMALVNSFRKYHESLDIAGLLTLICQDNASGEIIENTKKALAANLKHKIAKIYLEKNVPSYVTARYSMGAVEYSYNLLPVRTLEVWLETGGSGSVNLSLAVGSKDDKYLIATAVPVK